MDPEYQESFVGIWPRLVLLCRIIHIIPCHKDDIFQQLLVCVIAVNLPLSFRWPGSCSRKQKRKKEKKKKDQAKECVCVCERAGRNLELGTRLSMRAATLKGFFLSMKEKEED